MNYVGNKWLNLPWKGRLATEHYGRKMNNSRIKNIVNLSAAERYGYFIRKVSDFEEVWGLKDKEGWALMGNNEQVLFPVWSEKEFAELCKWDNYQPNSILYMTSLRSYYRS